MKDKKKRVLEIILQVDAMLNSFESIPKSLIEEYDSLIAEINNN